MARKVSNVVSILVPMVWQASWAREFRAPRWRLYRVTGK